MSIKSRKIERADIRPGGRNGKRKAVRYIAVYGFLAGIAVTIILAGANFVERIEAKFIDALSDSMINRIDGVCERVNKLEDENKETRRVQQESAKAQQENAKAIERAAVTIWHIQESLTEFKADTKDDLAEIKQLIRDRNGNP